MEEVTCISPPHLNDEWKRQKQDLLMLTNPFHFLLMKPVFTDMASVMIHYHIQRLNNLINLSLNTLPTPLTDVCTKPDWKQPVPQLYNKTQQQQLSQKFGPLNIAPTAR